MVVAVAVVAVAAAAAAAAALGDRMVRGYMPAFFSQ